VTLRIFIGYDPRQVLSYTALAQSIIAHSSEPVAITPLVLETLPIKRAGLTPFTFSRFLVPWLCNYEGWALFLDADIALRDDVAKLFAMKDESKAVMVSKNKMRFEWASVMLFNCAKCKVLTPDYVGTANGLHGIEWAPEEEIGELPGEWNNLVGYDPPNPDAKLIHYTQGIPAWPETKDSEHADAWFKAARQAGHCLTWWELMGNSVHAKPVIERLRAHKA
jgi:hypothetical protein